MSDTSKEREAFEAAMRKRAHLDFTWSGGSYVDPVTDWLRTGWVAALEYRATAPSPDAAAVAALPEWMPLLGTRGLAIRMSLLNEQQAMANHGQTLTRLAERGGLGPSEALAIVEKRRWRNDGEAGAAGLKLLEAIAARTALAGAAPAEQAPACPRIELVVAIHTLASHFENALYAFRDDAEALRKAKGDIAHAMNIAARHNQNGPGFRVTCLNQERLALRLFTGAAYPVSTDIEPRGYRWSEAYLDQALAAARQASPVPQADSQPHKDQS